MTLIIAHRGSSGYNPEMTIPAYELALNQNVDGLEIDVRLTKDLELVGIHDRKTSRVANRDIVVSKSSLKELKELDFSSQNVQAKIITLREFLTLALDSGKLLTLAIETKHVTRHHGLLEYKISQLLTEFALNEDKHDRVKIVLMSFNPLGLLRFSKINPLIPRVQLKEMGYPFMQLFPNLGSPEIVGLKIELLMKNPKLCTKFKKQGKKIFVWTADSDEEIIFSAKQGFGAVITNNPEAAIRILR
jgi:glycerophosphoryl diester phosphodiesterase